uniref:Uncharacterized protein n=1 Tax=Periophthalmus magnuspinnatus TaxID=409849 RepID=A0A3B4BDW9_9GOBI
LRHPAVFYLLGSCEYMGQRFNMGESWMTSDCLQCICMEPFGVGCCDHGSKPVDYPDWCEIIRKPNTCTSVAVMKANRKLPCLWGQGHGGAVELPFETQPAPPFLSKVLYILIVN